MTKKAPRTARPERRLKASVRLRAKVVAEARESKPDRDTCLCPHGQTVRNGGRSTASQRQQPHELVAMDHPPAERLDCIEYPVTAQPTKRTNRQAGKAGRRAEAVAIGRAGTGLFAMDAANHAGKEGVNWRGWSGRGFGVRYSVGHRSGLAVRGDDGIVVIANTIIPRMQRTAQAQNLRETMTYRMRAAAIAASRDRAGWRTGRELFAGR